MTDHDDGTPDEDGSDMSELELPAPIAELSALHTKRATARWDALAAAIISSAAPELARRRGKRGLARSILRWSRPVGLAAAAVLLAGAIGLATTNDAEPLTATSSFAEVVDREPASALLAADRPPSASDVEHVLDGDSFQQVQP